jgi:uncharacterized Ntn-hydrolase superfamily protein
VTFSIVACDLEARPSPEWGVAVASRFLAVGAAVPWAAAGAGAIATQALANLAYGPDGLRSLALGRDARSVARTLTQADPDRDHRQLGMVDSQGGSESFTGTSCFEWAGGVAGNGYACQGNILVGPEVVDRMAQTFEVTPGSLARRLLAALEAGDAAGGDRRGRQAAALVLVQEQGGYGGATDRSVDLRVDDHDAPVVELRRLLELHELYFPRASDLQFLEADRELADRLRAWLSGLGYDPGPPGPYGGRLKQALFAFVGRENLEERWSDEAKVERGIIGYLEDRAG